MCLSPSRSIPSSRRRLAATFFTAAAAAVCGFVTSTHAHGFGQRYDLPLPLSLYLAGAAAAVLVSFVIVGLFVRSAPRAHGYPRFYLLHYSIGRWLMRGGFASALQFTALALFIVVVIAGIRGDQNPYKNIAPSMVWIVCWVGLAYVSAFFGDLWALINPWRTIFETAETIYRGVTQRSSLSLRLPYPEWLGAWPAVALLLAFFWVELIYPSPAVPSHIACLAIGYTVLTLIGMFTFGCQTWLRHGEVFSLVFGTFARFAPIEASLNPRQLALRPFGAGLIDTRSVSTSTTAFVLLLLASVLYDGVLGTPEWSNLEGALAANLPAGDFGFMAVKTAGLVVFWLVFFWAYVAISAAMSAMTARRLSPLGMARNFVFTLVPIAIGYHLAHYLTFLLIQGQYIIPLVSDPFGFGWNLFGTAAYRVDIAIVGARFAWITAVTAILLGHIAAVYLAHLKALQTLGTRSAALRSQIPLTALMVVYTFVSLSILAEPIINRRAPAQPSEITSREVAVPADAVIPEPGSGRLLAVGAGKVAGQKLTYRMLGSAFHDGSRMSGADLLYSTMFAYRWGAGGEESHSDPVVATATAVMRAQLLAIKSIATDSSSKSIRFGDFEYTRELFVVEVYTLAPSVDPEQDAIVAPPWSTLPWNLLVLMEEAVERGWAAFSQAEVARRGVEWLDLVRSPDMNRRLATLVEQFEREGYRPERLHSLVSAEAARRRWAALAAFYREHGHFLVANGPYRLKHWSAGAVTLEAFRDLSYPLGVGSYDAYAVPRRGYITKVEQFGNEIRLSGDIELIEKRMRSYDIVRRPLSSVPPDMLKRASPQCRYVVIDTEGRVVLAGLAPLADDATFQVNFNGKLAAGRYTMRAEINVNGNAMNTDIRRIDVLISSSP
ncbi:MAG: hypothetical protein EXQ82_09070 [Pseudolabrys sp.]|nr:hypothetical protein [Pseudolabrys sp.]